MKINVGSGNEPLAGYVNIDIRRVPGVQTVADVTCLPFANACADEMRASSLLEHFLDPYTVLDELHRVMGARGVFVMRVPTPWSMAGQLDRTHVFLADLKMWRAILNGYYEHVRVTPEGVRYRDNKLLTAVQYGMIYGLRMFEFAQTWRFDCHGKKGLTTRAYIPWWLEEKYKL